MLKKKKKVPTLLTSHLRKHEMGWGTFSISPSLVNLTAHQCLLLVGQWLGHTVCKATRDMVFPTCFHNIFPREHFHTHPLWSFPQKFFGIYSCSLLARTRCPNCAWHCHRSNRCRCHLGTKLALLCADCTCLVCTHNNAELSGEYKASPSTYCPARGGAGNSTEVPTSSWGATLEAKLPSKNGNVGAFLLGISAFYIYNVCPIVTLSFYSPQNF